MIEKYRVERNGDVINSITGKIIKSSLRSKNGYPSFCASINGKKKMISIHRFVAETYIPNPLGLPEVNHKDGVKTNNNDWNLEWCTQNYNMQHAYKIGLKNEDGEKNPSHKLTEIQVKEIRAKYIPWKYNCRMLGEEYNVDDETIRGIVKGEQWTHI